MLVNTVNNKYELSTLIINELREKYGIKIRKDKKQKIITQTGREGQKNHMQLFQVPIQQLELKEILLKDGNLAIIPTFVYDTCQRILEHKNVEGLFRKAGSASRQKDIREQLESGVPLGNNHHVIDIANILKLFFRELPEPLIPPGNLQETILRCLLCKTSDQINAIMMVLLLLPPISLDTLVYFLQFLKEISIHSSANKMTIDNLAIIFAPGLMPLLPECVGQRLNSHVRIIKILIEYSHCFGKIPDTILNKIQQYPQDSNGNHSLITQPDTEKKKKKRRSGSLTRMFNGLKKIVGAFDSPENVNDKSANKIHGTPCLNKSIKKRRILEGGAFSSKKKNDVMAFFPDNQNLLPNTPIGSHQNTKRSRLSLVGKKQNKHTSNLCDKHSNTSVDKRWSVIGSGWSRKKILSDGANTDKSQLSSISNITFESLRNDENIDAACTESELNHNFDNQHHNNDDDYVRISKSEYEAIKERVSAIETRISQEFNNVKQKSLEISNNSNDTDIGNDRLNGPEEVLNKYEQTLEETEAISTTPATERLAKRLSKDLKIRRSAEQIIMRSPSARKIGTIRRRSRESISLVRHQSCNFCNTRNSLHDFKVNDLNVNHLSFYPKTNLKRGQPNTLQTGLCPRSPNKKAYTNNCTKSSNNELWASADYFMNQNHTEFHISTDSNSPKPSNNSVNNQQYPKTARFITSINVDKIKTPILPPRLNLPLKSPQQINSSRKFVEKSMPPTNKSNTPLQQMQIPNSQNGRASIARLRSQNAGMVMAKAKIYNELENAATTLNKCTDDDIKLKLFKAKNTTQLLQSQGNINNNSKLTPRRRIGNSNAVRKINRQKLNFNNSPTVKSILAEQILSSNNFNQNMQINLISLRQDIQNIIKTIGSPNDNNNPVTATPRIKRPLVVKSPRRLIKTPNHKNKKSSPMRATPLKLRNSPRYQIENLDF